MNESNPTNDAFDALMLQPEMLDFSEPDESEVAVVLGEGTPFEATLKEAKAKEAEALEGHSLADALLSDDVRDKLAEAFRRAHESAQTEQAQRYEKLIDDEPVATLAIGIIGLAANYAIGYRMISPTNFDKQSVANQPNQLIAQRLPNPRNLVKALESLEVTYLKSTPEDINQWQEALTAHGQSEEKISILLQTFDSERRAAAYEAVFQEIYGDRWQKFKTVTEFKGFAEWQANLIHEDPNEAEAIARAQAKFQDE